jgi:hypothetical protein
MPRAAETDVINSATPLEMRFEGVHPRLYATEDRLREIRGKLDREPYAGFLSRIRRQAEAGLAREVPAPVDNDGGNDPRSYGCALNHLVVAYRLTGEKPYFDAACRYLEVFCAHDSWTQDLIYGHWSHGASMAYDWLYHELDPALRARAAQAIHRHARLLFEDWGSFAHASPTAYAWNHTAVPHCGLMVAGCAIWGDVPGVGVLLRMGLEKMRLMVDSLGPDGASAEGLAYGQYHNDYLMRSMVLTDELLGLDLFADCAFFRQFPRFMLYSQLPRRIWKETKVFVQLGDSNGQTWCGPDPQLRMVARRYRDGLAQGLADAIAQAGCSADGGVFLEPFWHDETVPPEAPDALPPMHHLADKDIVISRSDWSDRASVFAIKCGPNSGHHAARRYRHDVSGGHMHPDAGHIILHALGEWLLVDDGYMLKRTSYQNTLLVNGIGQEGEGFVWFEDLPFRQGHPEGRILRAETTGEYDLITADAAPPYKAAARLRKFLRHVLYVRPDIWLLIDEIEAEAPSTFERRFHAPQPFVAAGGGWRMTTGGVALDLLPLGLAETAGEAVIAHLEGPNATHHAEDVPCLILRNANPLKRADFVTLLHPHPAEESPAIHASVTAIGDGYRVDLARGSAHTVLELDTRSQRMWLTRV